MNLRARLGKKAADGLVFLHGVWGVGAFASLPAAALWPGVQSYILWPMGAMLASWAVWRDCPLTAWERGLREKFDPDGHYDKGRGFVSHYGSKLMGVSVSERFARRLNYGYTAAVLLVIILI
ncbi:MAG TPA: DUF2784 family protein [Candidatus Paceibacterota bacterium]|nr:DUF2784 family protein [Candidatus Paceibacterota bacterium]